MKPPAIISIFLGDLLQEVLDSLSEGRPMTMSTGETLQIGVTKLPDLPKDLSDRNRTSPFAFTGNKFEFRMVGSTASISTPTTVLNVAVADVLNEFADELEKAKDLNTAVSDLVTKVYKDHRRIIFNGNGYSDEWDVEAEKQGLPNIRSTVEALPTYTEKETVELFERHKVLTKEELESRLHVYFEKYAMQINIEANVTLEMAKKDILPSGIRFSKQLAESILKLRAVSDSLPTGGMEATLKKASSLVSCIQEKSDALEKILEEVRAGDEENVRNLAEEYRFKVIPAMEELRECGDALEIMAPRDLWPFPSYMDLLFRL